MKRLKFTEQWDKLADPRFTTIRSYRPQKARYYAASIGEEFTLIKVRDPMDTRGPKIGSATLRTVRIVRPYDLPAIDLARDVQLGGKPSGEWLQKLLAMDKALLLEFENHTGILRGAPA